MSSKFSRKKKEDEFFNNAYSFQTKLRYVFNKTQIAANRWGKIDFEGRYADPRMHDVSDYFSECFGGDEINDTVFMEGVFTFL